MNREEVDHGSQGKEVEIEEEGQEGCGEKEDRREALRAEEKVRCQEKERRGEKESRTEEVGSAKTRPEAGAAETRPEAGPAQIRSEAGRAKARACSSGARARRIRAGLSEPDHLSPVQPTGGKRQSG